MEMLTGLLGLQSLVTRQHENALYDAAAGRAVRKQLFGEQAKQESEVQQPGSIVLGDINYPTPMVVQQPQQQSGGGLLKALLFTALSVAVPGAGAAGWLAKELLNRPAPAAPAPAPQIKPSISIENFPMLQPKPQAPTTVENPQATRPPGLDFRLLQEEDLSP